MPLHDETHDIEPVAQRTTHLTDLGNAERFVESFGQVACYVPQWGWLCWDGKRWARDELKAQEWAAETARSIFTEASHTANKKDQTDIADWALKSQHVARLQAIVTLARPMLAAKTADFDNAPMSLNVGNGILDLLTGTLAPYNPQAHLTKLVPVAFDPNAQAPTWLAFLARVMGGDINLISYLQRAIGYTLTARTGEQCLFFCYGNGANGKSVFLETVQAVLGDYAQNARTETVMARDRGGVPNDIARLAGARFVAINETAEGERFDESLIKDLTGGDTVTARFLHREYFEFRPEFKLWIRGNHKPQIRGTDAGIWRRLHLIPFKARIPPEERDPYLLDKLRAELPGILAWAVQGCIEWQRSGLTPPQQVLDAVAAYREEMDVIGGFLADRCTELPTLRALASDLYKSYRDWCDDNGHGAVSQTRFGTQMAERGFEKVRIPGDGRKAYMGISLSVNGVNSCEPNYNIAPLRARTMVETRGKTSHRSHSSQSTADDYRNAKDGGEL